MAKDPLLDFNTAVQAVLDAVRPLAVEAVPPAAALGRVAAVGVAAPEDLPRFAVSAMDGYAVPEDVRRGLETAGRAQARVVGEIAAGSSGHDVPPGPGEVVRIFTGGPVPAWAAAIAVQERADRSGDDVVFSGPLKPGANIRPAGGDLRTGDEATPEGTLVGPADVALLAALGVPAVPVRRRPVVGILVTGAELDEGATLGPGRIRDSNGPMLEAAARCAGAGEVRRARAGDTRDEVARAAAGMLENCDLLCVSGGVSVGDYDVVKDVLESLGVVRVFWRVAQRPGKPLYFGTFRDRPVLGLPGNPASALACFLAYAWPAMRRMQGLEPACPREPAVLAKAVPVPAGLTVMLRGRRGREGATVTVEPAGAQESHLLGTFAASDCLVLCPPADGDIPLGAAVQVIPFPWEVSPRRRTLP